MSENKNQEILNRWSKYDVTVGNAHAQGGARDRFNHYFFQLTDSLPDTKGPLSKTLTSSTITEETKPLGASLLSSRRREQVTLSSHQEKRTDRRYFPGNMHYGTPQ